jgi:hypothetical protein
VMDSNKQTQETFYQDGPTADLRDHCFAVQEQLCSKLSSITEEFRDVLTSIRETVVTTYCTDANSNNTRP